jgi:ABC-type xylose transport system permease subunit
MVYSRRGFTGVIVVWIAIYAVFWAGSGFSFLEALNLKHIFSKGFIIGLLATYL